MKPTISNIIRNLILVPALFIVHFFYQFFATAWLSRLPNADWGWETPLYAPGCYWMAKNAIRGCLWTDGPWDVLYFFGVTILVAIVTAHVIQRWINQETNILGKYYWRLIVTLLGWVFVPVPDEMTLMGQFSRTLMT